MHPDNPYNLNNIFRDPGETWWVTGADQTKPLTQEDCKRFLKRIFKPHRAPFTPEEYGRMWNRAVRRAEIREAHLREHGEARLASLGWDP